MRNARVWTVAAFVAAVSIVIGAIGVIVLAIIFNAVVDVPVETREEPGAQSTALPNVIVVPDCGEVATFPCAIVADYSGSGTLFYYDENGKKHRITKEYGSLPRWDGVNGNGLHVIVGVDRL